MLYLNINNTIIKINMYNNKHTYYYKKDNCNLTINKIEVNNLFYPIFINNDIVRLLHYIYYVKFFYSLLFYLIKSIMCFLMIHKNTKI